jgi:4-diphosphocytidyl-2-C-methyl-D-erythritol kinase
VRPDADEPLAELARAKVNLTLEIKGRRADGYHELESLVLFADFGDELRFRPQEPFSLTIDGPFGKGLETGGNLVERAALGFAAQYLPRASGAFSLTKRIPVAAGLGGGSADAAAALRLLARSHGIPEDRAALAPLAQTLGADVPCCLYSRASVMTGIGERLHPLASIAPVPALLVNPRLPLSTANVFRALAAPPLAAPPPPPALPRFSSLAEIVDYARARRNDLEPPARQLLPAIGEVLAALEAVPGVLLARLSGSGPTCYALLATEEEAREAAQRVLRDHPGWWAQPVMLS